MSSLGKQEFNSWLLPFLHFGPSGLISCPGFHLRFPFVFFILLPHGPWTRNARLSLSYFATHTTPPTQKFPSPALNLVLNGITAVPFFRRYDHAFVFIS
ncbi:hypothetical protein BS47DRAFT_902578 [Hydnum rufescens UP504]|uniref:Uncharacterized protein n=1 Tax=Hydnum rufescens UP504 TaxID=1448309 RepID=A0A9P6DT93_9AGAM|nr:hypothetical protein BS47DRAFT_902578 [Hydnum rufescens UP504]